MTVYSIDNLKVGIVSSRFNNSVVNELLASAVNKLLSEGVDKDNILHKNVPGALEIPIVANALAASKKVDVILGVGAELQHQPLK